MSKRLNKNAATIRQLSRILNHVQSYLDALWIHPRRGSYLDATVLTLLSKSLALARSTVWLVRGGFDEEAFASSRTLLELAMNLRYITNGRNPELRAKRFVHFVAKIKMEWGKIGVQYFKHSSSSIRQDMPNYREFRRLLRKYPKQGWIQASKKHAKGIWTMAMEPDRFERVPVLNAKGEPILNGRGKPKTKPFNWAFDYKVLYFWESQYVHVTIDSLDNHAPIPGEAFTVYVQGNHPLRRASNGDVALFNTVIRMHKILLAGFRGLGRPFPDELSKPIESLIRKLAEE